MHTRLSSNATLRVMARIGQILVALVFALAAGLKALHPVGFAEEIAHYGIFPSLSPIAAWAFLVVEFMLVAALLFNAFPRVTHLAGILLLTLFIGVTLYGMSTGSLSECGCFGNLIKRGPEQVLIEDGLMILVLIFASLVLHPAPRTATRWKLPVVVLSGALIAGVALASPALPVDNLVTDLKPGSFLPQWPVEGLPLDLAQNTHFVVLCDAARADIDAQLKSVGAIADSLSTLSVVGLTISGTAAAHDLQYGLGLPIQLGAVEPRFARRLYRTLPRCFLIHEGTVLQVWQGIPAPKDVQAQLASLHLEGTNTP